MAPKRSNVRRGGNLLESSRSAGRKLRSGCSKRRSLGDQEATSRVMSLNTSPKKRGRPSKRCVYVDDEALVEEDSNVLQEETLETQSVTRDMHEEEHESSVEEEENKQEIKHSRQMGEKVSLGLMKDVLGQFYVKRRTQPSLVPLCRLVVHEAVRYATDDATWLIPSFDTVAYMETMGQFLVSLAGPSGGFMPVTTQNLEDWGSIWRQKNAEFEKSLNKEWQDLKGRKFLVWDGNHRLKTWWKRIKHMYQDRPEYYVFVRCQFIQVEKKKEAKLLLALDTTNA